MFNYFHIFVFIVLLLSMKIMFLTNKSKREIIKRLSILFSVAGLLFLATFTRTQSLSKLLDWSVSSQPVAISVSSHDYGNYHELLTDPSSDESYRTLFEEFDIKYTMKSARNMLTTSDEIVTLLVKSEEDIRYLAVTSDNLIHYHDRFYSAQGPLYDYLLGLIKNGQ